MTDGTHEDEISTEAGGQNELLVTPPPLTMDMVLDALPVTADGAPIIPGMMVYCVVGKHTDEREVIGPYKKKALLTFEPARPGACAGSAHRLANTVYACRENALAAAKAG